MSSFFQELKERRIAQIVASYAVSGWVALEVVGALVERGIIPELGYRVGLVIYLGGLAVSIITGWYHGEKGHQETTRLEKALLVAVAGVTLWATVMTVQGSRHAALAATARSGELPLTRVAVLYFADQSRDGSLGYLADGLTEALIERLEDVGGVEVVSAAGASQFRDTDISRDSIASVVLAGTILEGSVARRGDDVRVSVTLYDGEGGAAFETRTLDLSPDDPFALQDAVSEEISELLRDWLDTEISLRMARRGTDDPIAWTDFQRGQRARRAADAAYADGDVQGFIEEHGRADSLFAAAEERDPEWAQPTVYRAILANRWGWLSQEEPGEASTYLRRAIALADEAVEKDARSARAYYVRGTTRYQAWQLGLVGGTAAEQTFDRARADLEEAVDLDPGLGAAWNQLSQLYSQIPDLVEANLAARRALEADEFLRSAQSLYQRLYRTSYDLEQFREAIQYCDEGRRRYPDDPDFGQCPLWLMAAPRAMEPDVDRAWDIADRHVSLLPPSDRERARIQDRLLVAMVLARAEMPDSALAVVASSQAGPDLDPTRELLGMEALVHLALGDEQTALDRLKVYLTASPEHRAGWRWTSHWWWRPLQDDPEFRRLVSG